MAFIFVPNADGSFTEGDRQTNPDTGVEYIYSDGAWRALGPKIEDEFDTLDDRYVNLTGSEFQIMEPSLGLLGGPEDTGSNLYLANNGYVRWGYGDLNTQGEYGGYIYMRDDTTFEIGTYTDVDLKIKASNPEFVNSPTVPTPTLGTHAANKDYVDSVTITGDYLPLSGGTLTGTLNTQLVKSTRNTGYAFEVKPDNADTVALIRTAGTASFKGLVVDSLLASGAERPFEIKGRLSDGTTVSKNFFYVYANNDGTASAINYDGKMDSDKNIVNKSFVDNKVPGRFTFEGGALYYNT